ncbi:tetratricopeptide repeat protein 33-like [Pecten maximus]|uniref:tetratricopeptide repeat protein 33-like n=1 Tax=Pecten maximus TaxID=6579 RepID=UPI0014580BDD|nr:tetratricopeptide repeat protein 33-like [Pecten maximus]XP_033737852.1 tetratricopeptide repeat protein 33-like [Pecten maximus]XP_033737853.1 tetratricopeptide repeat protein 33-like [Pecten maximus]
MTAFGWKRKAGDKVVREASAAFESDAKEEENPEDLGVDWLTLVPPKKIICLEDAIAKSNRLKQEGTVLADSERYWEALRKWDEAIKLNSTDETLYEMKSQVLLILCEVYPAVHMGERAVDLKPTWWVAHQTLGRARLGLGEVKMALKSFSRAVHLNPANRELWKDDLWWAAELWKKHTDSVKTLESQKEQESSVVIKEYSEDEQNENEENISSKKTVNSHQKMFTHTATSKLKTKTSNEQSDTKPTELPNNYVHMRDT